jgi:hypothetical protein
MPPGVGGALTAAVVTEKQRCVASAAVTGVYTNGDILFASSIDQRLTVWRVQSSVNPITIVPDIKPAFHFVASEAFEVANSSGLAVMQSAERFVPAPADCS